MNKLLLGAGLLAVISLFTILLYVPSLACPCAPCPIAQPTADLASLATPAAPPAAPPATAQNQAQSPPSGCAETSKAKLEEKVKALNASLVASRAEMGQLQTSKTKLEENVKALNASLVASRAETGQLQAELAARDKTVSGLEESLAAANAELDRLRTQFGDVKPDDLVGKLAGLSKDEFQDVVRRAIEQRSIRQTDTFRGSIEGGNSSTTARTCPPVWPCPTVWNAGNSVVEIAASSFRFVAVKPSADLTAAFSRYSELMFPHASNGSRGISTVVVNASDVTGRLQLGVDESYELAVPLDGSPVLIIAPTTFGALHALETLSQLVSFNFTTKTYVISNAPLVITDKPRFAHRELLIDTSRHFLPLPLIFSTIDAMSYAKLNVLHWHMLDGMSFPFNSPRRPTLVQAAFSDAEQYTTDDVASVVEYARQRGIRVVAEIDTPAHLTSICLAYPDACPETCMCDGHCGGGLLNPASQVTFDVIKDLLLDFTGGAQLKGLFPDNLIHLGGDELYSGYCWKDDPVVSAWMKGHNFTVVEAYIHFIQRVQKMATSMGRQAIHWEEAFVFLRNQLPPSSVVHVWSQTMGALQDATAAGYRVLFSVKDFWYLDDVTIDFAKAYSAEPCDSLNRTQCSLVLGGGGAMWGEMTDASVLHNTVWPRCALFYSVTFCCRLAGFWHCTEPPLVLPSGSGSGVLPGQGFRG
eukprot:TRINITY_DN10442_c0_g1_i1.p1 TRINITY_DN10442_c0_g1~~TRINITY_DN10442_c0_g1_i1.p1  ORF type:complete len:698 (-),score=76.75 TRINITY_DN10442_c0_g1_i1:110-2203(-)